MELSLSNEEIEVLIDDWLSSIMQDLEAMLSRLRGKSIEERGVGQLKSALECISPEIEDFTAGLSRIKFLLGKLDEMNVVEKQC